MEEECTKFRSFVDSLPLNRLLVTRIHKGTTSLSFLDNHPSDAEAAILCRAPRLSKIPQLRNIP